MIEQEDFPVVTDVPDDKFDEVLTTIGSQLHGKPLSAVPDGMFAYGVAPDGDFGIKSLGDEISVLVKHDEENIKRVALAFMDQSKSIRGVMMLATAHMQKYSNREEWERARASGAEKMSVLTTVILISDGDKVGHAWLQADDAGNVDKICRALRGGAAYKNPANDERINAPAPTSIN